MHVLLLLPLSLLSLSLPPSLLAAPPSLSPTMASSQIIYTPVPAQAAVEHVAAAPTSPAASHDAMAEPFFIYESVIAASALIPSKPPSVDAETLLRDNVLQEESAPLLLDDDAILQKEEDAAISKPHFIYESAAALIRTELEVHDSIMSSNAAEEKQALLLDDGGKDNRPLQEENTFFLHGGNMNGLIDTYGPKEVKSESQYDAGVPMPVGVPKIPPSEPPATASALLESKDLEDKHDHIMKSHRKLPIYHKLGAGEGNVDKETNLRMVVGDSSNAMVEADSEGHANPPKEVSLSMVVDDMWNKSIRESPSGTRARARSRSCTFYPHVCNQLAHADHMNYIALYGASLKKRACCHGICVDLESNNLHCGRCFTRCRISETCCNGKCTDLDRDEFNCGQCGHSCHSSPCQYGMCGYY